VPDTVCFGRNASCGARRVLGSPFKYKLNEQMLVCRTELRSRARAVSKRSRGALRITEGTKRRQSWFRESTMPSVLGCTVRCGRSQLRNGTGVIYFRPDELPLLRSLPRNVRFQEAAIKDLSKVQEASIFYTLENRRRDCDFDNLRLRLVGEPRDGATGDIGAVVGWGRVGWRNEHSA